MISALAGARLLVRALGGPGSGNFGHKGRPGEVGGSEGTTVYHGTTADVAKKIREEGLIPDAGPGADIVLSKSDAFSQAMTVDIGTRPPSVYVSLDKDMARQYADMVAEFRGQPAEVLEIVVPKERAHELNDDEGAIDRRFQGTIPKEWIKGPRVKTLGGAGSGHHGHEGRPGQVGGSQDDASGKVRNERSKRALKYFKPITAKRQRHVERNEARVRDMIGGERTVGNFPVDVIVGKHGIEVKTLVNNTNDKITVRKAALALKEKWAKKNDSELHTVVIDDRKLFSRSNYSGHEVYYARGSGSFRLSGMIQVTSNAHLMQLLKKR